MEILLIKVTKVPGGDHLYYNLYVIRVHENEEIGSFFGTMRDTCVSCLGYQKLLKWGNRVCFAFQWLDSSKRVVSENAARIFNSPYNSNIPKKRAENILKFPKSANILHHHPQLG